MTPSTVVSRTPDGSLSSIPIQLTSFPCQSATADHVDVGDDHRHHEQQHLDEREHPELVERHSPRVEEHDLDVEHDEQHRGDVVLHREAATAHGPVSYTHLRAH